MPLSSAMDQFYVGNTPLVALYAGDQKIWPSGFTPNSLSGLVTWLDAAEYSTGSWPNKASGPAVTLPGTPAPTVSANTLNGKPLVRFKGNEGKVRSVWETNPVEWTLIYLTRWIGPNPGRAFSVQYPPSNLLVGMHTSQPDTMYNNGTWMVYGTGWNGWTIGTTNPWRMYGADSTQSVGSRFFIDGMEIGTPVFNVGAQEGLYGGWGLSGYGAGNEETLDIEVAELVLYNRKLSDVDREQVEEYLRQKWGVGFS